MEQVLHNWRWKQVTFQKVKAQDTLWDFFSHLPLLATAGQHNELQLLRNRHLQLIRRMFGLTFGALPNSTRGNPINSSLDTLKHLESLNGFGKVIVNLSTKFSFDFCWRIDWAPEIYPSSMPYATAFIYMCYVHPESRGDSGTSFSMMPVFAITCWLSLNVTCPTSWTEISEVFEIFKQLQLHVPFFMQIVILFCWSLWTVRNIFISEGIQPSLVAVKQVFRHEFAMLIRRVKQRYFPLIVTSWVDSVVISLGFLIFFPTLSLFLEWFCKDLFSSFKSFYQQ